jgi:hypothetical protein
MSVRPQQKLEYSMKKKSVELMAKEVTGEQSPLPEVQIIHKIQNYGDWKTSKRI